MRAARKMRWAVQRRPLASGCRRDLRRLRYTRVDIRVGTWTLEDQTRLRMNCSNEGRNFSPAATGGGVLGGEIGSCLEL